MSLQDDPTQTSKSNPSISNNETRNVVDMKCVQNTEDIVLPKQFVTSNNTTPNIISDAQASASTVKTLPQSVIPETSKKPTTVINLSEQIQLARTQNLDIIVILEEALQYAQSQNKKSEFVDGAENASKIHQFTNFGDAQSSTSNDENLPQSAITGSSDKTATVINTEGQVEWTQKYIIQFLEEALEVAQLQDDQFEVIEDAVSVSKIFQRTNFRGKFQMALVGLKSVKIEEMFFISLKKKRLKTIK